MNASKVKIRRNLIVIFCTVCTQHGEASAITGPEMCMLRIFGAYICTSPLMTAVMKQNVSVVHAIKSVIHSYICKKPHTSHDGRSRPADVNFLVPNNY